MTSTNEAADIAMFDEANRPYLLAAQKHRSRLQKSDTEDLFSIARRLRTQVETARAADAKKPDATLSDTYRLALHRPGWRLETNDARRKKYQQRYPEGRESGTITEEENDDSGNWSHDRRRKEATAHVRDPVEEEALSDACERARNEYIDRVTSEYKNPR